MPPDIAIHDADSHIMEPPDLFASYADPAIRPRVLALSERAVHHGGAQAVEHFRRRHRDPEFRRLDAEQIWLRKNWEATGSFIPEDRPRALDLLGVASQLVFNTFTNKTLQALDHDDDLDLAYGMARAHNRAVVDFCAVDSRLLAVGFVPLAEFERSAGFAGEAIELGCKALMVASACPRTHAPSHVELDPVWAQAQEAGIPVVFHVGGGGRLLDPMYFPDVLRERAPAGPRLPRR